MSRADWPQPAQNGPVRTWAMSARFSPESGQRVIENSRTETVLPKQGPTEGADSMPE